MLHLILTVMSIALTAALIATTINYMPGWVTDFSRNDPILTKGFCKLEGAVVDYFEQTGTDAPPPPTGSADGGLAQLFEAHYRFLPQSVDGGSWTYGTQDVDGIIYGYVCLSNASLTEGSWRSLSRMQRALPVGQFVLAGACGATTSANAPSEFPATASATLFVTPGFQATSCN